jgi:hypothetical protein
MIIDSCRWHEDPNGRCADPLAFPGVEEVPPFCVRHISRLEVWVRSRVAAACKSDGEAWIRWAARKADETADELKAAGILRGDRRPPPEPPERR